MCVCRNDRTWRDICGRANIRTSHLESSIRDEVTEGAASSEYSLSGLERDLLAASERHTATILRDSRSALKAAHSAKKKLGQRTVHAIRQAAAEFLAVGIALPLQWEQEWRLSTNGGQVRKSTTLSQQATTRKVDLERRK
ncbi:uncharacterized protein BO97DRAFT_413267 [Aspergillus homomorphus CBS 101889]|uniref:Uncharacterized protein n=1 Tax=Aspergillus homomorphus (strain CBS 101889) TaxID=1450537 RepID=A0A395I3B6_ASPHC|nr:hypothetical protein BO97DRAFT_413267 [Aspergillus homomorphus CBS 101889]RAL13678.1 hypothetical protein BO97DRAFT_413267 [Aspergillus homomorphus CBS 101889]